MTPDEAVAARRRRDAEQARLLVEGPGWPWLKSVFEEYRSRSLRAAVADQLPDTAKLQAVAVAHFVDWLLAAPEKRLAEMASGTGPPPAVGDFPRPPRSQSSQGLVQ